MLCVTTLQLSPDAHCRERVGDFHPHAEFDFAGVSFGQGDGFAQLEGHGPRTVVFEGQLSRFDREIAAGLIGGIEGYECSGKSLELNGIELFDTNLLPQAFDVTGAVAGCQDQAAGQYENSCNVFHRFVAV